MAYEVNDATCPHCGGYLDPAALWRKCRCGSQSLEIDEGEDIERSPDDWEEG